MLVKGVSSETWDKANNKTKLSMRPVFSFRFTRIKRKLLIQYKDVVLPV